MNILSINSRGIASDLKQNWIRGLCQHHKIQFLGIQETYIFEPSMSLINAVWGKH